MSFIDKFILFFKNIFKKEDKIKMIDTTTKPVLKLEKITFTQSLKVETTKKGKIETLVCPGDGLGIQTKISS